VAALAQNERLGLLLDEFTYLLEIDPSIAGQLQNLWDQTLSRAHLFLVICGSHLGMMLRHTLSYQAPLYGRATAQLRLQPLPFGMTARFFQVSMPTNGWRFTRFGVGSRPIGSG
jgi:uncharacterized protein